MHNKFWYMNLVKLFWKQSRRSVLKGRKYLNWYLLSKLKDVKYEPEEVYYYEGDGVVCGTTDYMSWSMNSKFPKTSFKVAYH